VKQCYYVLCCANLKRYKNEHPAASNKSYFHISLNRGTRHLILYVNITKG
jgi:hypothetical protein